MILPDTCALLWTANGDPLAPAATRAISQATRAGALFLSPISAWEIGLLASRRKLDVPSPPEVFVAALFARPGVRVASFTPEVATRASFLPGDLTTIPPTGSWWRPRWSWGSASSLATGGSWLTVPPDICLC